MHVLNRRRMLQYGGTATALGLLAAGSKPKDDSAPFGALGACTSLVNSKAVKAAGGDYIEEAVKRFMIPDKPESDWLKNLEAAKASVLPIAACNSFIPGSLRSTGEDANHAGILDYSETAFRRGQQAGVKIIVFGSSGSRRLKNNFPKDKAEDQFVSLLKKMGPQAQRYGITVCVEPLRRQECNFINTVLEGAAIVDRVNHPNVRLVTDWYHMLQNGEHPADLLKAGPLVVHAHIAEKEKRSAPGVMGDDFRPFFSAFKAIGYTGRMSIEGSWKVEQLPKAYQTIRMQSREV